MAQRGLPALLVNGDGRVAGFSEHIVIPQSQIADFSEHIVILQSQIVDFFDHIAAYITGNKGMDMMFYLASNITQYIAVIHVHYTTLVPLEETSAMDLLRRFTVSYCDETFHTPTQQQMQSINLELDTNDNDEHNALQHDEGNDESSDDNNDENDHDFNNVTSDDSQELSVDEEGKDGAIQAPASAEFHEGIDHSFPIDRHIDEQDKGLEAYRIPDFDDEDMVEL
ncbi:hypothetical protein M8C21_016157 [Ambrosia artemisiifolia]|uniref:Uncharacterized protein n=1 Tax=Ambrosia artemisiifolia TaxID=4212 RepID=A0AAD5CEI9_AMBAR|nr:hypothetical protein M8C21_016157 [Ambrosia artemisiifolia]